MRFRLHKLIDSRIGTTQYEEIDRGATWLDDDLQINFLKGQATFTRSNDRILADGEFETATTVQCVRSLEMFELPLTIRLEDLAYRLPGTHTDDDTLQKISSDLWVDLQDPIREAVVTALPMNPVHPRYRDATTLAGLMDGESEWLTIKWAKQDDSKS